MEIINRAWFCLSDPDRRYRYDEFGEAGVGTSAASEQDFIETSAVEVNSISSESIISTIILGFDVFFFLMETFVKAMGSILTDGGSFLFLNSGTK